MNIAQMVDSYSLELGRLNDRLADCERVRRQLAEALRNVHRTPSEVIFAALAASDALDRAALDVAAKVAEL